MNLYILSNGKRSAMVLAKDHAQAREIARRDIRSISVSEAMEILDERKWSCVRHPLDTPHFLAQDLQ